MKGAEPAHHFRDCGSLVTLHLKNDVKSVLWLTLSCKIGPVFQLYVFEICALDRSFRHGRTATILQFLDFRQNPPIMARSLIHPSSNIALMYISSYWQSVSALPSASLASQKPVEVLFHNDTSCHNSSSVSQAAVAKDPEFLPTTTFGVFSVLLAFGSLIVGVIGIMHHRRRRRSLSRINTISQQSGERSPLKKSMNSS